MTHASQFGTRQSWKPDLTSNRKADKTTMLFAFTPFIGSIYTPALSSAGGTQSGLQGTFFLWADCRSPEARLPPHPARAIPTPADRRGARAPRKGTCCETLEHTSPSRPFPAKISPTPRQRSLSPPQGVLEKAFELRVQVFSPEAARTKALPETQNRDTEV